LTGLAAAPLWGLAVDDAQWIGAAAGAAFFWGREQRNAEMRKRRIVASAGPTRAGGSSYGRWRPLLARPWRSRQSSERGGSHAPSCPGDRRPGGREAKLLPQNKLGQYQALIHGNYGGTTTTTQPYFRNIGGDLLAGATTGLGLGCALFPASSALGPWGPAMGAEIGGLLNLF